MSEPPTEIIFFSNGEERTKTAAEHRTGFSNLFFHHDENTKLRNSVESTGRNLPRSPSKAVACFFIRAFSSSVASQPRPSFRWHISRPFWWLPLPILQNMILIAVNQLFINSCLVTQNQRGTKTGQNHGKIKSRTLCPKYPLWNTSVSFAKVQICPLKNEGKSLFISFTTHFPTIVPQMWLLQTVLTSNGLVCENWVLNFVLHSVGHFQKRELAIEPKICHPYCPILVFVNV